MVTLFVTWSLPVLYGLYLLAVEILKQLRKNKENDAWLRHERRW